MRYNVLKREIICEKILSNLDKFVLDFVSCVEDYVIVSGYVFILLGRTRATEDVDLLIPQMTERDFLKFWKEIYNLGFWCINTSEPEKAFNLLKGHAIRFAKEGRPVPNIEFKIIKNDLDRYSYENRIKVVLKDCVFFISPLELQIAYKLFLAADGTDEELQSDKDIEDARHLYKLFKDKINKDEFVGFINQLNIKKRLRLLK